MKRLGNIWNDVINVDLAVQDIVDGTDTIPCMNANQLIPESDGQNTATATILSETTSNHM